jgi:NAD(P)-dependent dehydrogenase (short-subunit alcohol dehydrogenase family)
MNDESCATLAITGGASGIGLETARAWVASGGKVILLDRDLSAASRAAVELGSNARAVEIDVTDAASVAQSFSDIRDNEAKLDGLVNAAGVSWPAPSAEISEEQFTTLIDIHLNGTQRCSQAAFHFLKHSSQASIVNLSSVASRFGMPQRAAYCAGKAGIDGLTRTLAVEWAPMKIRVNSVAPGYVRTALTNKLIEEGKLRTDRIIGRTPMGRFAEPEEISEVIMFLLSSKASYITGHRLAVDGGMTIEGDWY